MSNLNYYLSNAWYYAILYRNTRSKDHLLQSRAWLIRVRLHIAANKEYYNNLKDLKQFIKEAA